MGPTAKLKIKALIVPGFVGIELSPRSKQQDTAAIYHIPITELDEDALEELAYGFLLDLYKKVGKHCPFYRPAKADPAR